MYSGELMAMLSIKGLGVQTLHNLLKFYGSVEVLVEGAKNNRVYQDTGIKITKDIHLALEGFEAKKYHQSLKKEGVNVVTFEDENYPSMLRELEHFPPILHYKGHLNSLNELERGVAVVGSRRISPYGKRVAFDIGRFLGRYDLPVISGLAYGVDYEVHRGVVYAGGRPFAILANGLETIYPKAHVNLSKKILERGALITEEFLYSELANYKFPIRNRLISGLAKIIVVVEAEAKSGSLITAQHALEQGKTVYAVPGSIYSETSKGTNQLIADGAIPLLSLEQLLDEYNCTWEGVNSQARKKEEGPIVGAANDTILKILQEKNAMGLEDLARCINMTSLEASVLLMKMELEGQIRSVDGNKYMVL